MSRADVLRDREEREGQEALIANHKRTVREKKEAEARAMDERIRKENAQRKAAEWKKLTEEQQWLIEASMEKNAELGASKRS